MRYNPRSAVPEAREANLSILHLMLEGKKALHFALESRSRKLPDIGHYLKKRHEPGPGGGMRFVFSFFANVFQIPR
jgi:hypothetical protein